MIKTKQEKAFEVFASVVMICVMVIVIFPFLLLFISSITEENTLLINGYSIFPEKLRCLQVHLEFQRRYF